MNKWSWFRGAQALCGDWVTQWFAATQIVDLNANPEFASMTTSMAAVFTCALRLGSQLQAECITAVKKEERRPSLCTGFFFVKTDTYDIGHEEYKSLSPLMEHRDGSC